MNDHFLRTSYLFTILLTLLFFASQTWAAADYYWKKSEGEGYGNAVRQTFDGGFIIGGTLSGDICLTKTDADGDRLWVECYGEGFVGSVQQTADGGYILFCTDENQIDAFLIKTTADGTTMWTKGVISAQSVDPVSLRQTNDGGYVLGVNTWFKDESTHGHVLKTDDSGCVIWSKRFEEDCNLGEVQPTTDGGYITAGCWGLLKIDAQGNEVWTNSDIQGTSVQQTIDGGYIVMIVNILTKTDSSGNPVWVNSISYPGGSLLQTTDGGYMVRAAYLIKTDAGGNVSWGKKFSLALDVQLTDDGGYIIVSEDYLAYYKEPGTVNEYLSFTPLQKPYPSLADTDGCPSGTVGKFVFDARLTNESETDVFDLAVVVEQITNGNLLLAVDNLSFLKGLFIVGEGGHYNIPMKGDYADGILKPGESILEPFTVCLKNWEPFSLHVNVVIGNTEEIWLRD